MNVKIADLMSERVISAQPHHTVEHVRGLMERNKIKAVPVVGPEDEPVGIITSTDMAKDLNPSSPVSSFMTKDVTVIPAYNDVSAAARVMRKNKIHHVVVTHEKRVVGIISSFDLLELVEDKRFVMKNPPTKTKGRKSA